ncbi:MAG: hypothetical protein SA339_13395 [Methanomassiliicoccus sp.]|nr:hypothetical protein [Methanomassiliicoccus sp.]
MFFMDGNEDRGDGEEVPRSKSSHVEVVHRALFFREEALMKDHPGARAHHEFQDDEPRAILWLVGADGAVLSKEFLETAFSADREGRDDEYIEAARRYGSIAIHYPGAYVPKEHVIRRMSDLWVKIRDREVQERASITGFLYGSDGRPVMTI